MHLAILLIVSVLVVNGQDLKTFGTGLSSQRLYLAEVNLIIHAIDID